jgi:hypothetical protein
MQQLFYLRRNALQDLFAEKIAILAVNLETVNNFDYLLVSLVVIMGIVRADRMQRICYCIFNGFYCF